jgi:hypothetical protein
MFNLGIQISNCIFLLLLSKINGRLYMDTLYSISRLELQLLRFNIASIHRNKYCCCLLFPPFRCHVMDILDLPYNTYEWKIVANWSALTQDNEISGDFQVNFGNISIEGNHHEVSSKFPTLSHSNLPIGLYKEFFPSV